MTSVPTPDEFIASFPNSDIPPLTGEPNYETLHELRQLLKENAASVTSNRGGGVHGYLGIVVSAAVYTTLSATAFTIPTYPGATPVIPARTPDARTNAIISQHKEDLREWREYTNVQKALVKQLTSAIDRVYLAEIRNPHTGYNNTTLRQILAHLFTNYGSISPQDLLDNENRMKTPWNPSTPFETLLQQVDDAQEYADAGGQPFTAAQLLTTALSLVFNTGLFFDDCKTWNRKDPADKTWTSFKNHFRDAYHQYRLQQKTTQQSGFHAANSVQIQSDTAEALAHLANAASTDRNIVATLTASIERLTKQLSEQAKLIENLKHRSPTTKTSPGTSTFTRQLYPGYCWTHGHTRDGKLHNSTNCKNPRDGHQKSATATNQMGGNPQEAPARK